MKHAASRPSPPFPSPASPFLLAELLEVIAEFCHRFRGGFGEIEVDEAIAEASPDEELEREVIHSLGVFVVIGLFASRSNAQ